MVRPDRAGWHRISGAARRLRIFAIGAVILGAASGACTERSDRAESATGTTVENHTDSRAAERGERLYGTECASCHGAGGDRLPIAPLDSVSFLNSRGDATLLAVVADGKGTMPAYGEARGGPFDQEEVTAVVAYLNALAGRSSTTLLAAEGEALYSTHCASCHGPSGDRIPIAPLDAQGYLDSLTDARITEVILTGTATMKGLGGSGSAALTDRDATAIASFLRNQVQERTALSVGVGRDLYVGNCLSCHGTSGSRAAGVDLASGSYLTSLGDGRIISAITQGTESGPAFGVQGGGAFAVPDTASLIAYLKTWAGLNATAALSLGTSGTGGRGEALFVQNCAPCHGPTGDNVAGVQLKSDQFLTQKTRDIVSTTIRVGNELGMPAWSEDSGGPLTNEQIDSIVDYLFTTAGVEEQQPGAAGGQPSPFGEQTAAEFFGARCAGCHGVDRSGGVGPALLPDVLVESDDFYRDTILSGRPGTPMPAWSEQGVTEEQAAALVEFLKAETGDAADAGDEPASSGDLSAEPLFDGETAEVFFAANCAVCHGTDRSGGIGPALLPDTLLEEDAFYEDTILSGRPGTAMPVWGDRGVTPEQAAALVDFITSASGDVAGGDAGNDDGASASPFDGQSVAEFFGTKCAACHGADRSGGIGPALLPDTLVEDNAFYESTILNGRPGTAMPVWGDQGVTAEQAAALVEFLKRDPDAAAAGSGPAASSTLIGTVPRAGLFGKELFQNTCALCHGADGLSVANCPIGSSDWQLNTSFEGFFARIASGKPSQGMPTWSEKFGGPLSDEQIISVMQYVGQLAMD